MTHLMETRSDLSEAQTENKTASPCVSKAFEPLAIEHLKRKFLAAATVSESRNDSKCAVDLLGTDAGDSSGLCFQSRRGHCSMGIASHDSG